MTNTRQSLHVALALLSPLAVLGGATAVRTNPPGCDPAVEDCGCPGRQVSVDCVKVAVGLGETTPWTGSLGCVPWGPHCTRALKSCRWGARELRVGRAGRAKAP